MTSKVARRAELRESDLLQRLQNLLYEYHALGRFDDARPHILWLMEIAEQELGVTRAPRAQRAQA